MTERLLLAGLGNPGKEYEMTRHNVGFMTIDAIADKYSFSSPKNKFHSFLTEGKIDGCDVVLIKPQTYMNKSGVALSEAAAFYKTPLDKIIVIHDELDLDVGKIRIKTGGGAAGHNGLKDIDSRMGKDYVRLRIGIGHPGSKERVTGHVLGKFTSDEKITIDSFIARIADQIPYLLDNKIDKFLGAVNV